MSDKITKQDKNNIKHNIFKWSLYVIAVIVLEGIAIGTSFLINESKTKENSTQLDNLFSTLKAQQSRINSLEELPTRLTRMSSLIAENNGSIKLVEENFNSLKQEVGNKKLDILNEKISNFSHRIETLEESKNKESLILSVALIIKENALYGRDFSFEINVLNNMAQGQENIKEYIEKLFTYKNKPILDNNTLANRFYEIEKNFSFEKPEQPKIVEDRKDTVSKSIRMIKETVASINLDKVVVLKKDNKTAEQKELLSQLKTYVNAYQFGQALELIDNNSIFFNSQDKTFNTWYEDLKEKVQFELLISRIVVSELSAIREEIKTNVAQSATQTLAIEE
ncbi:MAG: hypothetical protein IKW58_03015 [Alphaproteobacteria bacterium]|nr:hypothetical protein [Alphaproteobacteria bacterium]